jgi:hypothetical protein
LIVTLVIIPAAGLQMVLGTPASRLEKPCFWLARAFAKATPTGPSFGRSSGQCAISLPSPTSRSPDEHRHG